MTDADQGILTEYKKSLLWTNSLQLYCMVFVPRPLELIERAKEREAFSVPFLCLVHFPFELCRE